MTTSILFGIADSALTIRCEAALRAHGVEVIDRIYHRDPDAELFCREPLPDFIFACDYPYLIREPLLSSARRGAVNLHPAVLPHNRGRHSTFWGIMNRTPLGATIHWMDATFDTGDVIAQATFEDDGLMTAQEVYDRQMHLCGDLFETWLPRILDGTAPRTPQMGGDYHKAEDIKMATEFVVEAPHEFEDQFEFDSSRVSMDEILRLIRATSHGDHGFYVTVGGVRYKVQGKVTLA